MIENPILKGFCPDPCIIRVKDDFYIATSTFEWWPGVRLWNSKDLKNWKQIKSPLCNNFSLKGLPSNGGIWAPDLSYHDGTYYLVYTIVTTNKAPFYNTHNYLVTASSIEGPWTDPVYLNSTGFDPSLFHSIDGKTYLINMLNGFKGIVIQEYCSKEKGLKGDPIKIMKSSFDYKTEGPHIYFFEGYYYLIVAEGGTGFEHCVSVLRSNNLFGPYDRNPNNPLITSDGDSCLLKKGGHGSLVRTETGDFYISYLCSRVIEGKNISPLGRESAIDKLILTEDGWFKKADGTKTPSDFINEDRNLKICPVTKEPEDEYFTYTNIPVWFSFLRKDLKNDYSLDGKNLILYGRESLTSHQDVSLIAKRCIYFDCSYETRIYYDPKSEVEAAGLVYFYNTENFIAFLQSRDEENNDCVKLYVNRNQKVEEKIIKISKNDYLDLKLEVRNAFVDCYYSFDEKQGFKQVFSSIDGSHLSDEIARGFTGTQIALFCQDMSGNRGFCKFNYLKMKELIEK